jgi:NAD(P)-dependent dehydrogenase (short-subunit alcohol dehydrogenase family)
MMSGQSLAGKHALVTGGGRGIGVAIARTLLMHGARVTLAGRNIKNLADTVGELKSLGEVDYLAVDVAQRESVAQAFSLPATRYGRTDILINNAGHAASAPFMKTDEMLWRHLAQSTEAVGTAGGSRERGCMAVLAGIGCNERTSAGRGRR